MINNLSHLNLMLASTIVLACIPFFFTFQLESHDKRTDRRPYYDNTRDVHLTNQYYEKEYNDEEYTSEEYYEEDEYEIYLNTRSGPYPKNAVSKNKRRPVKFQNPLKITVKELEMEEPTPEPVIEPKDIEWYISSPKSEENDEWFEEKLS
ncbi:6712_t:CDS:2 [Funneliformis caledonium]|uniref:6712_t:CDS:1 n=1 Tax=Funneliformis caledonium TaxID=1117310 RepID=A0A9N9AKT3_9GLOM|nr:6712_t:CDS:2 [Funneliformis caledonium]